MLQRSGESKPGLRDYWQILLRRKWIIILPFVAIISIAIPGSFLLTPVYEASTTLITEEVQRASILQGVANIPLPRGEALNTIRLKIESRSYTRDVAGKVPIADYLKSVKRATGTEDIVKYIRSIVNVRAKGGRLIEISVRHPIPSMAKDIANAVATTYKDKASRWRQDTATQTTEFIRQQMDVYWGRLQEAEEALVKAQEKSPLGYLDEDANSLVSEAARTKTELFEVEMDLTDAKLEFQKTKKSSETGKFESSKLPLSFYYQDPKIKRLEEELTELRVQYAEVSKRYTDWHPEARKLKDALEQKQSELDQEKNRLKVLQQELPQRLQYWQDRIESLEARKTALDDKRGEYDRKLQLLPQRELQLARLQREKSVADKIHSMLISRLNTLELIQTSEASDMGSGVEVLDLAIEPDDPISPNKKKIAFLAVAMGVMLGFGSAFVLEYFDRSLRSVDEVTAYLDLPVLATIPRLRTYETDIKDKKFRRVKIVCIVSISLLVLIIVVDLATAKLSAHSSLLLKLARSSLSLLRQIR